MSDLLPKRVTELDLFQDTSITELKIATSLIT